MKIEVHYIKMIYGELSIQSRLPFLSQRDIDRIDILDTNPSPLQIEVFLNCLGKGLFKVLSADHLNVGASKHFQIIRVI
jgi:hypothetical protein